MLISCHYSELSEVIKFQEGKLILAYHFGSSIPRLGRAMHWVSGMCARWQQHGIQSKPYSPSFGKTAKDSGEEDRVPQSTSRVCSCGILRTFFY